jgi:hypothetical protein
MPERILERDWLRFASDKRGISDTIRALATKYHVSQKAMELRLVNLGFISPVE